MFYCSFDAMLFPLDMADPLSVLLERLSDIGKAAMYSDSTGPPPIKLCDEKTEKDEEIEEKSPATNLTLLPPETELTYALIPGNILKINDTTYQIERKPEVPDSCTICLTHEHSNTHILPRCGAVVADGGIREIRQSVRTASVRRLFLVAFPTQTST